jgi:UDP-N-acetylmuramyl pentapeptide phosphotransferase/UDP-N-acetylglucosamine-1-phosphate transferase
MVAAALSFLASALICGVIVYLRPYHQRYSIDAISEFPQKIHNKATPRIGGLAIFGGVLAGALWTDSYIQSLGLALVLCGLPALLGGIGEDLTKKVSTVARLLLTFAAAAIAFFVLDASITDLALPGSSWILGFAIPSLLFTMFAVGGLAHGINIVDGLNGLAGFTALLVLGAIAWVATQVGDQPIALIALVVAGSVAGFLVWNFPRGALFLGDGGSYFLGFLIAELAVLLVHRNSDVSPWFALTVLAYPVCETLFSSFRRRLRGQGAMDADGLHLHTLIYKRLVRRHGKGGTGQNALAAVYLAVLCAAVVLPAMVMWDNTPALQGIAAVFTVFYLILYRGLVRFRFPRWLSARGSVHNAEKITRRGPGTQGERP